MAVNFRMRDLTYILSQQFTTIQQKIFDHFVFTKFSSNVMSCYYVLSFEFRAVALQSPQCFAQLLRYFRAARYLNFCFCLFLKFHRSLQTHKIQFNIKPQIYTCRKFVLKTKMVIIAIVLCLDLD